MNTPTPKRDEAQERRTFIIAVVFLVAILVNFVMSLSLGFQSGDWQQFARAGTVLVFGVMTIIAITHIRRGSTETGIWLIISGFLFFLISTALLLAGFGLILGLIELALAGAVAPLGLPKEKRSRAFIFTITAAAITYGLDFLPLNYRLPAPAFMAVALPVIAALVILVIAILVIHMNWESIVNFLQSSIRNRLTAIVVGAAIIPVVLISLFLGWVTYVQVRNALTQDAFDKLAAVQQIKAIQITSYMAERQGDMMALSDTMGSLLTEAFAKMSAINSVKRDQILQLFKTWDADVRDVASDPGVVAGMRDLASGYQDIGANAVRSLYLGKSDLAIAKDGSSYSAAHMEQQGFFSGYIAIHGYVDALLIDPQGNVVYSVQKNDAFGTNLVTGAYKDSNLAGLYKNLITAKAGKTYIADVALFEDKAAMFIGTPIYDGSTLVGILAYQLPLDVIKNVIAERTGQGSTGETFMIALESDGRITYRSERVTAGNGKFVIGYDTSDIASPVMRSALNGEAGGKLTISSTGEAVVNAYQPLGVEGLNWAIFTRVAAAEALSPTKSGAEKDFLTAYKEEYGYYDLFLIEPKGTIFYSVAKEPDYLTNILTGEYSNSNLGLMVSQVMKSKDFEFADFAPYAPSGGKPAAFFAIPVLDANNNVQMIVAAQASQNQLSAVMEEATGLGKTGETFIVGEDKLRRTETRFLADLGVASTVLNPDFKVDTVATRSALAGESGQATFTDFRGLTVLGVWSPLVVNKPDATHPNGQIWAVIAKLDQSEALAPVSALAGTLGLIIGLAMLVIGSLAVFVGARFALNFVAPILNLTDTATQVAAGNMSLTVKTDSKDEFGTLSNAFNKMTSQLRDLIGSLEGRVAARTKDLATVANISTQTSIIQDPYKMLEAAVHLTQRGFNLYHAHVFTYHEDSNDLQIVVCGYREGDVHEGTHGTTAIPISQEQSLVARTARTRKPVIVNDVRSDPGWLPNPLLPDTHAEMAVPMIVGDELLGVLDVQADHVDAFTESDANIQMTLASQIATSLKNAQSYSESKAQADLESLVNSIGQKIQRATTVEDTLQTAIREIGVALGASRVKANIGIKQQSDENNASNN